MRPPVGATILAVVFLATALSASAQSRRALSRYFDTLSWFASEKILRLACKLFGAAIRAVLIVPLLLFSIVSLAQLQSETRFEYDGAGNIIRILNEANDAPPTVSSLTPDFINRGSSVFITAHGSNLVRANVVSLSPDLTVDQVVPTFSSVRFRLVSALDAPIGLATLQFETRLGTTTAEVFVAERTPIISTIPNPIVLRDNSEVTPITLLFDASFDTDQTYQVSIRDTGIATVQETTITLPAGSRALVVHLSGVSEGNTTLDISRPENFVGLGIPVIVVANDSLPSGTYQFTSAPVGVVINVDLPLSGSVTPVADAVGVVINVDLPLSGPVTAVADAVGVVINVDQPFNGPASVTSDGVNVSFGASGNAVSPGSIPVGGSGTLTINGTGLETVTGVIFVPDTDITQTAAISVNADGTILSVPFSVASGASPGIRAIVFSTTSGDVVVDAVLEITP